MHADKNVSTEIFPTNCSILAVAGLTTTVVMTVVLWQHLRYSAADASQHTKASDATTEVLFSLIQKRELLQLL